MQSPRGFFRILIIFTPLTIIKNCSGKHAPERGKHNDMQVRIKCQETKNLYLKYNKILSQFSQQFKNNNPGFRNFITQTNNL